MAISYTTLSATITAYQTQFAVASTSNISAPVLTTGSGYTWLLVENELMWVTAVPVSGTIQVTRGMLGTQAVAHNSSAGVVIGLPSDFSAFVPALQAIQPLPPYKFQGVYAPVTAAATITATGPVFHITGATQTTTMNPPSGFVEGQITVIADTNWSWGTTTAAFGFATSGTATTYPGTVTFTYDAAKAQWYPSRVV